MGMVAALAFLMMVSLAVSSALNVLISHAPAGLQLNRLWPLVSFAISVAVFALLFATIFRYLPDVEIEWRDVWLGSGVTALLFALGKELVGYYLGRGGVGSAYGAAGSLVAVLVWVYFSSLILFLGAELTQVIARRQGRRIRPSAYAVAIERVRRPIE